MSRTTAPLSSLITDSFVRRAFERAERDNPCAPVVATRPKPVLSGSAVGADDSHIERRFGQLVEA
jgi:hypothetical protein